MVPWRLGLEKIVSRKAAKDLILGRDRLVIFMVPWRLGLEKIVSRKAAKDYMFGSPPTSADRKRGRVPILPSRWFRAVSPACHLKSISLRNVSSEAAWKPLALVTRGVGRGICGVLAGVAGLPAPAVLFPVWTHPPGVYPRNVSWLAETASWAAAERWTV